MALQTYKKCYEIDKQLNNKRSMSHSLSNIGNIYLEKKQYEEAINYYQESLSIAIEEDNVQFLGGAKFNIALVHQHKGELNEAIILFKESLIAFKDINELNGVISVLEALRKIYTSINKTDEFSDLYNEIISYLVFLNSDYYLGHVRMSLGFFNWSKRNYKEAETSFEAAYSYFIQKKEKILGINSLLYLMMYYIELNDKEAFLLKYNELERIKLEIEKTKTSDKVGQEIFQYSIFTNFLYQLNDGSEIAIEKSKNIKNQFFQIKIPELKDLVDIYQILNLTKEILSLIKENGDRETIKTIYIEIENSLQQLIKESKEKNKNLLIFQVYLYLYQINQYLNQKNNVEKWKTVLEEYGENNEQIRAIIEKELIEIDSQYNNEEKKDKEEILGIFNLIKRIIIMMVL